MSTQAERRATERQVQTQTAGLLLDLANLAGISESPTALCYRLARILGATCSQATVKRLHDALKSDALLLEKSR